MAGTRRRSRVPSSRGSDTRTAAPATAQVVVDESPKTVNAASGDEGNDNNNDANDANSNNDHLNEAPHDSSADRAPGNRSTTGLCRRCKGVAGEFYNAWHKITGTYYLPALLSSYSSRLRWAGKQKAATVGTDLDGCLIQPLACPAPACSDVLGFVVVDAPASKHVFRGREFFKLPRIELRCEVSPKHFITVEPHIDAAPLPVDGSARSSPAPDVLPAPGATIMEVDTRQPHVSQPPPPPSGLLPHLRPSHEQQHHDHHRDHHHQPLRQVEPNSRQPSTARSPEGPHALQHAPPQKSPSNPLPSPAVKPVHDVAQYSAPPPPPKEASVGLTNRSRDLPPVISHPHSHSHSPAEQHRLNGQYYPRPPQDVGLDAIERLQTQISQNSGALNIQSRDLRRIEELLPRAEDTIRREFQTTIHHQSNEIRRVDEAVGRLQHEMMGIRELLEALTREVTVTSRELQNARATGQGIAGPSISAQDSALELMANQVSIVSQKANEVDTLKITIEIMKNKIQRLEEAASGPAPAPQQQAQPHHFPSPREPTVHSAHSSHTVPSYHNTPSAVPHINTPVHPAHRPQSFHSHGTQVVATPEGSQRAEPAQTQSGWVTVNANAKRAHPHPNGVDGPHEHIANPAGSPKRPKLAPLEPRVAFGNAQQAGQHQHVAYDQHMDTDDSESRIQTHTHSLPPSQTTSRESIAESTLPSQHAAFVAYHTQDAPSEDSWRPESQRVIEHRAPRGRGRGGGPGSRGGRGRKSLPAQIHLGTPEWEKEDWQGVKASQMSPEGFYSPARSRPFVRRGSGGGGVTSRGGRPSSSSDRAVSLGLQSTTSGVGLPSDPYAHTKKTRTKPTRNADGVLIRKDGRPDMRSQSSAANLRKVHARKEEFGKDGRELTPSSSFLGGGHGDGTPSPTMGAFGQDLTASVQKKHSMIMGKIFPTGVDASRKEHDYARQVFDEGQDHTAHPRNQHHHHHHVGNSPLEIKREQMEDHRMADSQSPNDGDVDMDRADDHADDEGQTPSERSVASQEEERGRTETRGDNGSHVPEISATAETTQTVS